MQTSDHMALARYLLKEMGQEELLKHKKAFLLGCIEPDYNPLSYLRGSFRQKNLRGHNAENAHAHIRRCMEKLNGSAMRSAWSCFVLGTLMHYVADAFTFPHNAAFHGTLLQHVQYEKGLHRRFRTALGETKAAAQGDIPRSVGSYYEREHRAYCRAAKEKAAKQGVNDCDYIIAVCRAVLQGLLYAPCNAAGYYPAWEV